MQKDSNNLGNSIPDFDAPRLDFPSQQDEPIDKKLENKSISIKKSKHSDLYIRLRTGLIYAITVLALSLLGNIPSLIMISGASGICAYEFFLMLRSDAKLPNEVLGIIGAVLFPVSYYFLGLYGVLLTSLLLLFSLLCWYVFWYKARIADVCISFFGAVYTGGSLTCLLSLRLSFPGQEIYGGLFIIFLLFTISINDGFAYLFGKKFGKHQFAPRISPKKTWEGFLAGFLVCTLSWCILLVFPGISINLWQCLFIGVICSLVGVIGDLVESKIKRNSGVKDSGTLMPGHGGLLDRLDSIFLVSLCSALLLYYFECIPLVI